MRQLFRVGGLFSEGADALRSAGKLGLKMFVFVVDAGEGLAIEDAVVTTVVDPWVVVNANYVSSLISRLWESWEGKETSGDSVWWKLVSSGTLEADNTLGLFVTIRNTVRIVTDVLLWGIS